MTPSTEHIAYLWKQWLAKKASRDEVDALFSALRNPELDPELLKTLQAEMSNDPLTGQMEENDRLAILDEILRGPVHSVQPRTFYLMRQPWIRYAAASILILLGFGVYFHSHKRRPFLRLQKRLTYLRPVRQMPC